MSTQAWIYGQVPCLLHPCCPQNIEGPGAFFSLGCLNLGGFFWHVTGGRCFCCRNTEGIWHMVGPYGRTGLVFHLEAQPVKS